MVSLVPILQAKLEWEHEEQDDESQSYADGNPAPGFGLVGRVNGALVVPSGKPAVYLSRVDDGNDAERQTAEDRYQNRLYQVV